MLTCERSITFFMAEHRQRSTLPPAKDTLFAKWSLLWSASPGAVCFRNSGHAGLVIRLFSSQEQTERKHCLAGEPCTRGWIQ
jgi:hypothetical protein